MKKFLISLFVIANIVFISNCFNAYSFGRGTQGRLGTGNTNSKDAPTRVITPNDTTTNEPLYVITAGLGQDHTVIYMNDKKLYSFGANLRGQLGTGVRDVNNNNPSLTPVEVKELPGMTKEAKVTQISCGLQYYTVILTDDSKLYSFGQHTNGYLGNGQPGGGGQYKLTPELVLTSNLQGDSISQLSVGNEHAVILSGTGKVYAWGRNENGEVGDGTNTVRSQPTFITFPQEVSRVTMISTFGRHTLAIANQKVYAWGLNTNGQLGLGNTNDTRLPTAVKENDVIKFKQIKLVAAGLRHSAAYDDNFGHVYSWGYNRQGQLGDNSIEQRTEPILSVNINTKIGPSDRVDKLWAGYDNTFILTRNSKKIYGFGRNDQGQLGDGTGTNTIKGEALDTTGAMKNKKPVDLFLGYEHSLVITSSAGRIIRSTLLFVTCLVASLYIC